MMSECSLTIISFSPEVIYIKETVFTFRRAHFEARIHFISQTCQEQQFQTCLLLNLPRMIPIVFFLSKMHRLLHCRPQYWHLLFASGTIVNNSANHVTSLLATICWCDSNMACRVTIQSFGILTSYGRKIRNEFKARCLGKTGVI